MAHEPIPRNVPPRVARARSALGGRARTGATPEAIDAARAELRAANAEAAIQRVVDAFPPLSDATKAKLACLLLTPPSRGDG